MRTSICSKATLSTSLSSSSSLASAMPSVDRKAFPVRWDTSMGSPTFFLSGEETVARVGEAGVAGSRQPSNMLDNRLDESDPFQSGDMEFCV
jgi:hypothetical protein